ncbi:hypothetical protein OROGR_000457 [Orobanche gracilis]
MSRVFSALVFVFTSDHNNSVDDGFHAQSSGEVRLDDMAAKGNGRVLYEVVKYGRELELIWFISQNYGGALPCYTSGDVYLKGRADSKEDMIALIEALQVVKDMIPRMSYNVENSCEDYLVNRMKTCMSSKLIATDSDFFANLHNVLVAHFSIIAS